MNRHAVRRALVAAAGAVTVLAGPMAVPVQSAGTPQVAIRYAASPHAIPGSYLVVLKDGADAADVAARYGTARRFTYTSALRGFAARMNAATARELAADPRVAYVEQDQTVRAFGTQLNPPWGLDRIDQVALPLDHVYNFPNTGNAATVYVVDTGLRFTHTEFGGRAVRGVDTVGDGQNGNDCNGHGTHMAGTIGGKTFGVAKRVKLVAVRVLSCTGSGSTTGVIAGIDWITAHHGPRSIANVSLGGGASTTLDNAVQRSINSGVVYALTSGSSNSDACNFSPARVRGGLTVGASTMSDTRAPFSNFGPCVDLYAPGISIPSAWITSDTATNTISGTSSATAHGAGAAALYWTRFPARTNAQVVSALVANAVGPLPILYIGFIPA